MASASPAEPAAWGGHGGGGYRGGGYSRGGYGYGGGYGSGGLAAGPAVGAALAGPYDGYDYGPPAYYAGPGYYGYYEGCRRHWVWDGYGYRLARSCY